MQLNYSPNTSVEIEEIPSEQPILISDPETDKRLNDILDMIGNVAALDFSKTLITSKKNDMIDAVSLGLNMLSEELSSSVVEKSKLDSVNKKLEKFAYTTAHDLRSPLASIIGFVTLLEAALNPEQGSEIEEYLTYLKKTTEQMRSLIQGILEYSKADAELIKKEIIDLNEIFEAIINSDQISEQATVKIANKLPVVFFNKPTLIQIIRNLLTNAIKYSDKDTCEIAIESKVDDGYFQIRISDNGPGVALEDQNRIFEWFDKNDDYSKEDSHGIGLATVKSILDTFGEHIWVESVLGKGSTFCFTLKK